MAGESSLNYGGIQIGEPFRTVLYERTPIMNGPDYLYTRHRIHCRGVWNGGLDGSNRPAAEIDVELRKALVEPRSALLFTSCGTEVLESPGGEATVDCANGPIPLALDVSEIIGTKTWLIDFAVETYVHEGPHQSVLISHRWQMSSDIDQSYFETRTIRGRAIFRTDLLDSRDLTPDDFRRYLFHPIAVNFQRVGISVVASEDGTSLEYQITDREQSSKIITVDGATKIEGIQTIGAALPGAENFVWDLASGILNRSPKDIVQAIRGNVPVIVNRFGVKVWGSKQSRRASLQAIAMRVVLDRISSLQLSIGTSNIFVTHDLMGQYVEANVDFRSGPAQGLYNIGQGFFTNTGPLKFPDSDDLNGIASAGDSHVAPVPISDQISRGGYRAKLAAQVLGEAGAVPARATLPGNASNSASP